MVNRKPPGYQLVLQVDKEEMKEYGAFFRSMRKSIRFSQEQMAGELGVYRTTVYRWEKGYHIPKKDIEEIEQKYRDIVKKYKI